MVAKNRINWLKKSMQVEGDIEYMQTNFGGHGLSSFGHFGPFHFPSNFPFGPWIKIYFANNNVKLCI